jgi:putative membrane protein
MHDMWHHWGGAWQTLLLGVFVAALIVLVIVLVAKSAAKPEERRGENHGTETPLEILKKRYARGEIDEEEFQRKRRRLEERFPEGDE